MDIGWLIIGGIVWKIFSDSKKKEDEKKNLAQETTVQRSDLQLSPNKEFFTTINVQNPSFSGTNAFQINPISLTQREKDNIDFALDYVHTFFYICSQAKMFEKKEFLEIVMGKAIPQELEDTISTLAKSVERSSQWGEKAPVIGHIAGAIFGLFESIFTFLNDKELRQKSAVEIVKAIWGGRNELGEPLPTNLPVVLGPPPMSLLYFLEIRGKKEVRNYATNYTFSEHLNNLLQTLSDMIQLHIFFTQNGYVGYSKRKLITYDTTKAQRESGYLAQVGGKKGWDLFKISGRKGMTEKGNVLTSLFVPYHLCYDLTRLFGHQTNPDPVAYGNFLNGLDKAKRAIKSEFILDMQGFRDIVGSQTDSMVLYRMMRFFLEWTATDLGAVGTHFSIDVGVEPWIINGGEM